ncbi:MAG: YicC family protein [Candidatus Aminicenantes bacterium RBG_16_63_16]|nr:MAG: YicC family protein [Candidatus Aminicenantes bacterium RBG_16_63_16]
MTGYGERRFEAPGLRARISVKTLNHRYFDWSYKGQPLGGLEVRLKALAQKTLQRGRVEAAIDLDFLDPAGWEVLINEGLLEKILETAQKAAGRLGEAVRFSVENLFRIPQVVELRHKDLSARERAFLETAFDQTLAEVVKERLREGRETARQVRRHLRSIRRSLKQVESLAGAQPRNLRDKLELRLKKIENSPGAGEGKLEAEAALLAQRADIAEEILRLRSHLDAFDELVREERDEPVGKMLDFLAQELSREANTINSKSQDIGIVKASLAVKGEVETIRQHIQNIE